MGRPCTICTHEKRAEIEAEIISGQSFRGISRHFAVSPDSVERHAADHLSQEVKQSQTAKEEAQGLNVVQQLKDINEVTRAILKEAREGKKKENGLALQAIDRIGKQLELQAKILGDIDRPQVNVYLSPEWLDIRKALTQALAPFPDARIAVATVLAQIEDSRARLN